MRDLTYPPVIVTAKAGFRLLGQKFQLTGTEHVPRSGGVLLAYNHIGYVDFIYGGLAANPSGRKVRFMAKRELFENPVLGAFMRSLHHIEVDRAVGREVARRRPWTTSRRARPSASSPRRRSPAAMELKEFKSGAVRIAAEAGVPLVPVIMWGTQRMMTKDHPRDFSRGKTIALTVGEPMYPTPQDNAVAQTAELHRRMSAMLDQTVAAYPHAEQPPGAWWVPARLGGTAPTLDEAARLDAEEKRERARRRAAKRAEKR